MDPNTTFKERAVKAKEILAKQKPVTIEEAKRQVEFLKNQRKVSSKKNRK